jgi:preprotein translocase subunit YajC
MRFFPLYTLLVSFTASPAMSVSYAPAKAIAPGMQVVDVAGSPVGTIQSVQGGQLIVKTDRHEVRLPAKSFTPDKGKLVFGMTREALNRATDAKLANAFLPGSAVHGKNGALVGHIAAIGDRFVTVELQSGEAIRLPRDSVAPGANGAVLGITATELRQMVESSTVQIP